MAELELAKKFHALSSNRANQPVVARRGTVPTLMKLMQSTNADVNILAAETLLNLSSHPENPKFLCGEKGLIQLLFKLFQADDSDCNPEFHNLIKKIFDNLRPALSTDENTPPSVGGEKACNTRYADGDSIRVAKNRATRVKQAAFTNRQLTLAVTNMQTQTVDGRTENLSRLEEVLQTTRGVVSYTVDASEKSVSLFGSTPVGSLLKVLEDEGFTVNVTDEKVIEPVAAQAHNNAAATGLGNADNTNNAKMPAYASASSKFGGGGAYNRTGNFWDAADSEYKKSIVLHGFESNSLSSRLQKQKEAEKHASEQSSVAGFLKTLTAGWW